MCSTLNANQALNSQSLFLNVHHIFLTFINTFTKCFTGCTKPANSKNYRYNTKQESTNEKKKKSESQHWFTNLWFCCNSFFSSWHVSVSRSARHNYLLCSELSTMTANHHLHHHHQRNTSSRFFNTKNMCGSRNHRHWKLDTLFLPLKRT